MGHPFWVVVYIVGWANHDGQFNVADPVFTLSALFSNGALPPAPFGGCGVDPTEDGLTCDQFDPCP